MYLNILDFFYDIIEFFIRYWIFILWLIIYQYFWIIVYLLIDQDLYCSYFTFTKCIYCKSHLMGTKHLKNTIEQIHLLCKNNVQSSLFRENSRNSILVSKISEISGNWREIWPNCKNFFFISCNNLFSFNPNLGGLFRGSFCGGRGGGGVGCKITPLSKTC